MKKKILPCGNFILSLLGLSHASVFELTEFTSTPDEVIYIKNRSPVILNCAARFASEINFKCNGKIVSDKSGRVEHTTDVDYSGQKILSSTLTVQRKQVVEYFGPEDYWCICLARSEKSNEWEKTKKSYIREAYLEQKFQKPLPQSGGVKYGEKFVLDCRPPRGVPKPVVTWLKDGELIDIDSINYETTEKGDLIVNKVDHSANGNYTCRARSIVGTRETPIANVYVWVNGQWSNWSEWSKCTTDGECGVGTKEKYRTCSNPSPVNGKPCRGQKYKTDRCIRPCPKIDNPSIRYHTGSSKSGNPEINLDINLESDTDDSKLILIASLAGAAGLALVIFVVIFVYFRSRRNFDYFKKADLKKAPFNANHDFDLIRAPSQVDARTSHPEYSSICNRKEGLETLEQLLYRPESSFAASMKHSSNGYGHMSELRGHSYPVKLEPYAEEYGTRSSSGVSTDRNQDPDICTGPNMVHQLPHQLPVHGATPHTPQRLMGSPTTQFHPSYPTYSYPNPYQPR